MSNKTVSVNSDGYWKNNLKSLRGGFILGAIFIVVHFLNTFKIMDLDMDTTGILYFGLGIGGLSLFAFIVSKGRAQKQRVTYTIENNQLVISGNQSGTYDLSDYIVTGKIMRANLGKTVTCTLVLEPREGKKVKFNCFLDEKSFNTLLSAVK